MQRPLTGNHVAKQLKRFFRNNQVKYVTLNRYVIIDSKNFPPLVFKFEDDYVIIYDKTKLENSYSFPCGTINTLFAKLLQYKVLKAHQLFITSSGKNALISAGQ